MIRVLFVCLGNICRSPMAEAVFRHKVMEAGLSDQIEVDSAGTAEWHTGKPPHEGTREKLDEYQITYEGMVARQVHLDDFSSFHYILGMDDQNIENMEANFSITREDVTFCRLMELIDNPKEVNVPDPYFTGNFDYTYELIQEACDVLLEKIRKENNI